MATIKKPIGINILIGWQLLITAYCIIRLYLLIDVASIGGIEFGISNTDYLRYFYLIVCITNFITFIGFYKRLFWSRWLYIIALIMVVIFRLVIMHFNPTINSNEISMIIINLLISGYLLVNKNVKKYFASKR